MDSLYSVTRRQENRTWGDRCSFAEAKANESFTPLMPLAPTPLSSSPLLCSSVTCVVVILFALIDKR